MQQTISQSNENVIALRKSATLCIQSPFKKQSKDKECNRDDERERTGRRIMSNPGWPSCCLQQHQAGRRSRHGILFCTRPGRGILILAKSISYLQHGIQHERRNNLMYDVGLTGVRDRQQRVPGLLQVRSRNLSLHKDGVLLF